MTLSELTSKIKNMIRPARVTQEDTDDGIDSICQVEFKGTPTDCQIAMPYGLSANVPKYATLYVLSMDGSSQSLVGIPTFPENRFRNLKENEVKTGNFLRKNFVYFKDNGDVVVKTGFDGGNVIIENQDASITMTLGDSGVDVVGNLNVDGNVSATGNLEVGGTIDADGDITAGLGGPNPPISVLGHVHTKVTIGDALSGPPSPAP